MLSTEGIFTDPFFSFLFFFFALSFFIPHWQGSSRMSEVLTQGVRTKKCLTVRAVAVEDAVIKFFPPSHIQRWTGLCCKSTHALKCFERPADPVQRRPCSVGGTVVTSTFKHLFLSFTPGLTPSLPRCHLKTTDKNARFETLKPFCFLFRTGM